MKRACFGCVGVGLLLVATGAAADDGGGAPKLPSNMQSTPPPSDAVSAQLFFQRGRDAATGGDASAACSFFEESLRFESAVGTLFNLASCKTDLGELASAWQYLREGIDRLDERDPRRKAAEATSRALESRVHAPFGQSVFAVGRTRA